MRSLAALVLLASGAVMAQTTESVVEYYDAHDDLYFISASPAEQAVIDSGADNVGASTWNRTGGSFNAYTTAGPGNDVCRFYDSNIPPVGIHFYTAIPAECANVQATLPAWHFESGDVFNIPVPVNAACASGFTPVIRYFDQRVNESWRFTTDTTVNAAMLAKGWANEGVQMCAPPPPVPAPSGGLGSDHNYHLYSDCNPLIGVSVTIDVTQAIVSDIGFSFQLNATSPPNNTPTETAAWQQYNMALLTTNGKPEIIGAIENWPQYLATGWKNLFNFNVSLVSMPSLTLPAGYQFKIILENDANANVTAANFVVIDNQGVVLADFVQPVVGISGSSAQNLSPITSFTVDFVAPNGGRSAVFSSGAGTITYAASTPLTILNQFPACSESDVFTVESSNSVYEMLPATPSNTIIQSFGVTD